MSLNRMAWSAARHQWPITVSLVLGVAIATAVITGALLVGDSMRGSLRALTLQRLGRIDTLLIPGGFFEVDGIVAEGVDHHAVLFFPAAVLEYKPAAAVPDRSASGADTTPPPPLTRRGGSVQVLGIEPSFWDLDTTGVRPRVMPGDGSVVLNESAAGELGVRVGDSITVRLPIETAVPADSPLGRRDSDSEGLPQMKVVDIIPDRGLGRFAIVPDQAAPQIAYLDRGVVAGALERDGQANALLLPAPLQSDQLRLDLADFGLKVQRVRIGSGDATVSDYYSVTSDRLLLDDAAVRAVTAAMPAGSVTPAMTYLANAIERDEDSGGAGRSVPYSILTAIDDSTALPLDYRVDGDNPGDRIPVVINSWAADQLQAEVGTPLRIAYFEPETDRGKEVERFLRAVVTEVVPLTTPSQPYRRSRDAVFDQPPTVYNDPHLTPTVPGVTDQDSISDWDLPFQLTRKIERADDQYWNDHRLTPKMFMPLAQGRRWFGSRFGDTTSLKIASSAASSIAQLQSDVLGAVLPVADELGWKPIEIRKEQLDASRGTTPFDGLFLSLSFFVIAAAVMLIAMLYRLGLQSRLSQLGTLMAIGWLPRDVARWVLREGLAVAAIGTLVGVVAGFGYAGVVLSGLRSWWVGAVTVPFLEFYWTPTSLLVGGLAGWSVAALTLWLTVRVLTKVHPTDLLAGRDDSARAVARAGAVAGATRAAGGSSPRRRWRFAAILCGSIAVVTAAASAVAGGMAAAGGFVGGGMLLLIASMIAIYARLKFPSSPRERGGDITATQLATRNATRSPLRSTLTIALMAFAAFLIIAVTAFRLEPTDQGTGGFDLIGRSAQPIYRDLADPQIRKELLGSDAAELGQVRIATFRLRSGQDASCSNLYQATQPTVLGIPASFGEEPDATPEFATAGVATSQIDTQDDRGSSQGVWSLLQSPADGSARSPYPVILDQNTAMWSLQMRGGVGEVKSFRYGNRDVHVRVVALLSNSILQGSLMMGEANFQDAFPDINGYQFFLVRVDSSRSDDRDGDATRVAAILEDRLSDNGMDLTDAKAFLASLLAVQNTYLRTFQSLGGLGLLLGTIGLAVSQLRGVLERRRELSVMRAIGFGRARLAKLVMTETAVLLLVGLGCGVGCAVVAVLPYGMISGLRPPLWEPLLIVASIWVLGMLAGLIAVVRLMRLPLLASLRSDG